MQKINYTFQSEQRLDSYLLKQFPSLTFGKISTALKQNKIKVNSKKEPLSYRLKYGDVITLYILDLPDINAPKYTLAPSNVDIVYEDENILIANKPQGLITIDENDITVDTLINRVLNYLKYNETGFKPALCHRLDTGTGGIVIIAKTSNALNEILDNIKNHKFIKEYKCITFGIPKERENTITSFLLKDPKSGIVKSYSKQISGSKTAITQYYVEETNSRFALINVKLLTGRTHQIRVHMKSIDCPILGDSKYGNNEINNNQKASRQLLFAYKITFPKLTNLDYLSNKTFCIDTSFIYDIFHNLK